MTGTRARLNMAALSTVLTQTGSWVGESLQEINQILYFAVLHILPGAATSSNSRGGLSFAHLFSGSTPDRAIIIHKTTLFIIHHISHFSMFPMALGTM